MMRRVVALLRGVNVGGVKVPMPDLKRMCIEAGFQDAVTYVNSGNAVFSTDRAEAAVKAELERRLTAFAGRPIGVMLRDGPEMAAVLAGNPWPERESKYTVAIFLDEPPAPDTLDALRNVSDEEVVLGRREIYVWYGSGQGRSKLIIPAAKNGTARNMNSVAKLAEMTAGEG